MRIGRGVFASTTIPLCTLACSEATAPPGPPVAIAIEPVAVTVFRGATTQLAALVTDSTGQRLSGIAITWASADSDIATISASGAITGRSAGQSLVTASASGLTASAPVAVLLATGELQVTPVTLGLVPGGTLRLTAALGTPAGPIDAAQLVSWTSRDTSVAAVLFDGTVAAKRAGTTRIIAATGTSSDSAEVQVAAVAFAEVLPGFSFYTCGLSVDSTAYCWGYSRAGGLGTATSDTESFVPVAVYGGRRFVALAVGEQTACGLTSGRAAYCWGNDYWGQLGTGANLGFSNKPVPVAGGQTFTAIGVGMADVCALDPDGAAWCWGTDYTDAVHSTPTKIPGAIRFVSLSVGASHTCGLTADSVGYCWGANGFGELGDGSTNSRANPEPVMAGGKLAALTAGSWTTCALTAARQGLCWGWNNYGQIGDSSRTDRRVPVSVAGGLRFLSISIGIFGTCAVATGQAGYCWGIGLSGQAGSGFLDEYYLSPHAITGGLLFKDLRAGDGHACGISSDGAAYCWGNGDRGELGDGSTDAVPVPSPSRVAGQP
jgi:hypothetical protein